MTTTTNTPTDTSGSVLTIEHGSRPPFPNPGLPSVDELKRAWAALTQGAFREPSWTPGDHSVTVLGCVGGAGASTVSLAIAEAAGRAVLIDGADTAESGLIAAGRTELGSIDGWARSARSSVLIVRRAAQTLAPPPPTKDLTVVDAGVCGCVGRAPLSMRSAGPLLYVTTATVPALRRLELALANRTASIFAVAVRGQRRWDSHLTGYLGPQTRTALRDGRCVTVPYDKHLALYGLDTDDLPKPLLDAASRLLDLLNITPSPVPKGLS